MAVKGLKEITAIAILLLVNAFFGISDKQTQFVFPAFGQEVFKIINFYTAALAIIGVAFTLVLVYRHFSNTPLELPVIPPTASVILNFSIFLIIFYIIITWLFTGGFVIPEIPQFKDLIEQGIISADENTIAFIFVASILPLGSGLGNAQIPTFFIRMGVPKLPWNIVTFGEFQINFNPPDFNRFKYGFYGIIFITLLHAGTYSFQVETFEAFYTSLVIAGFAFCGFWWTKESFGYGASLSAHTAWNLVLISIRGSVY